MSRVLVEFVGLFSPYAHPDVTEMLRRPARTLAERKHKAEIRRELTKQERKRQMGGYARYPGKTHRVVTPASAERALRKRGITGRQMVGTYRWGPHNFVTEMTPEDYEVLLLMDEANKDAFRVVPDVIVVRS